MENKEGDYATYLGDGLYAKFDGWQIELLANNPDDPSDTVYLEQDVYQALVEYANRVFSNKEE